MLTSCVGCLQDLLIYDEEMDQLKHISFEQALYATGYGETGDADPFRLFNGGGGNEKSVRMPFGPPPPGGGAAARIAVPAGVACLGAAGANGDRPFTQAPTTAELILLVAAGVWVPLCITITRPFIEHLMMSTICTVSGRDTGATRAILPLEPRVACSPVLAPHARWLARAQCSARRTCRFRPTRA